MRCGRTYGNIEKRCLKNESIELKVNRSERIILITFLCIMQHSNILMI